MLLWLTQRVSTTSMMVIAVLTVIFALLAYFLGLSVWIPLMWTVVFRIILVTVSTQAE
ncbi:MAG: hypothetical protein L0I02_04185 [Lactobacillus sp.]|nr:hypothetical protein [Lactobacillus sp.]MDN6052560.1 hypothetical protein [Lactobacillus sp.]